MRVVPLYHTTERRETDACHICKPRYAFQVRWKTMVGGLSCRRKCRRRTWWMSIERSTVDALSEAAVLVVAAQAQARPRRVPAPHTRLSRPHTQPCRGKLHQMSFEPGPALMLQQGHNNAPGRPVRQQRYVPGCFLVPRIQLRWELRIASHTATTMDAC